jgi:hypothetical protein
MTTESRKVGGLKFRPRLRRGSKDARKNIAAFSESAQGDKCPTHNETSKKNI